MAKLTSESLWSAIRSIGSEDGTADKLSPALIAKLIELKFVELSRAGLPQLTANGQRAYIVMESEGFKVPELDDEGALTMRNSDFVMTYPCYFLYCEDGGLACIAAGDSECVCVCLFTDIDVLRDFWRHKQPHECGANSPMTDPEVAECRNYNELIQELTYAESELADDGCHYIAIDPTPAKQVIYILIREFIKTLPAK